MICLSPWFEPFSWGLSLELQRGDLVEEMRCVWYDANGLDRLDVIGVLLVLVSCLVLSVDMVVPSLL